MGNRYGKCVECNCELMPSGWFIEREYRTVNGIKTQTSRRRKALESLVCPNCLKEYPVDDSFDEPWTIMR